MGAYGTNHPFGKDRCHRQSVRDDIFTEESQTAPHPGELRILIFGGSRGAQSINQSVMANLDVLSRSAERISVLHQSGRGVAPELKPLTIRPGSKRMSGNSSTTWGLHTIGLTS